MRMYLVLLSLLIIVLLSLSVGPVSISALKPSAPSPKLGISESNAPQQHVYSGPSAFAQNQPVQPSASVVWGPPHSMTTSAGTVESPAAMHPTNPMLALSGANQSPALVLNTTDGGATWQQQSDPHPGSGGDTGVVWLPGQ